MMIGVRVATAPTKAAVTAAECHVVSPFIFAVPAIYSAVFAWIFFEFSVIIPLFLWGLSSSLPATLCD